MFVLRGILQIERGNLALRFCLFACSNFERINEKFPPNPTNPTNYILRKDLYRQEVTFPTVP